MKEFKIDFNKEAFDELKYRIELTRIPYFHRQSGWQLGTPMEVLKDVLSKWYNFYDSWREQENYLNRYPQFLCEIDGVSIHFFLVKSSNPEATPILMAHGWPDSFLRYSKTFPLLKDFHLIVGAIWGVACCII